MTDHSSKPIDVDVDPEKNNNIDNINIDLIKREIMREQKMDI